MEMARNPRLVVNEYHTAVLTIGTTEVPLRVGAQNLNDRKQLIVYNDATAVLYLADEAPFTIGDVGNKIVLFGGQAVTINVNDLAGKTWYAKTEYPTVKVLIAEVK